ncbi:MAG: hypothetical protein IJM59_11280 [Proteobacteria bacterium]|nr:hypothetical protein [Pseudomonadota bacterium]
MTAEEYAQNLDKYTLESVDPNCISPYNEATCGAINCSEYTECGDQYICIKADDNFKCVCPNGMVEVPNADGKGNHCANPFVEDHCGITAENPAGSNCTTHENSLCNGEQCACKPGWVNCNGECIDPLTNDEYCGADAQCKNGKQCKKSSGLQNQQCTNGVCECTDEKVVNCNGDCVDPNDNSRFCGARGLCNSDDVNSPNYRGLDCGKAQCSVTDSIPKCECADEEEYYDESKKECDDKYGPNSVAHCGDDLVDCRAKYHAEARCTSEGLCRCPNHYAKLDDEKYKDKYEDKLSREGIAEPSILCVDIRFDHRFCGEDLVTCKADEMCLDGTCQPISKTECEVDGRTLCENRCINFEENHMDGCSRCMSGWCSTELQVKTAGCNTKAGIGLNNCRICLYNEDEQIGTKCNDIYSRCVDNDCACAFGEEKLSVHDEVSSNHVMCVNMNNYQLETCTGSACPNGFKCRNGWGDCIDGDKTTPSGVSDGKLGVDGCETNVHEGQIVDAHTINNCGACGTVCAPAHVDSANCSQGICSYRQCEAGYADCDGNTANGCESLLASDANNCGICGKSCSEGGCQNSTCCWNDAKYSSSPLTQDDCCEGTYLYKACDNNPFQKTRYTCASDTPTVDTDGWCVWSKVE